MTRITITITLAFTCAAILVANTAFAAGPAAGEYPQFTLFDAAHGVESMTPRDAVRAGAIRQRPLAGEASLPHMVPTRSGLTREQVRLATRDGLVHGASPRTGEMS